MDKIKTVKIKNPDGSVSEETYTISVDAKDVDMANGKELQETIGTIDIDTDGNIAEQLKNLNNNVDSLNIDIKKKAYFFDTVADMKNAKLKVGDYACTLGYYEVNDGGAANYRIINSSNNYYETLNNNLKAELISNKNNILSYGVEITDKNSNNHTIIKYVIDNEKYAFCDKDIILKNTLVLDCADSKFKFKKINANINDYAIIINNTNIILEGDFLEAYKDGLRVGLSNVVLFCNIKINRIKVQNIGITLGGTAGVYYNTFDITRLDYKTNGIKVLLDNYYVGENNFYNTGFTDLNNDNIERYAFHCNATNYRATGFRFYNISVEGTHGGFYFEGNNKLCEFLQIFGLRATECSWNGYKILKIKCNSTTVPLYGDIFFDNAKPSSFDFSEYTVSENSALVLHGAFRNNFNNSNDLLGYEGYPCYTKLILSKLPRGYDSPRTSNSPVLVQATSLVGLLNTGETVIPTLKLKIGDNHYVYNGDLKIYIDNANITSVDIYANDGETLVRSILINNRPCIINMRFNNLATNGQTEMMYSISNIGAANLFE